MGSLAPTGHRGDLAETCDHKSQPNHQCYTATCRWIQMMSDFSFCHNTLLLVYCYRKLCYSRCVLQVLLRWRVLTLIDWSSDLPFSDLPPLSLSDRRDVVAQSQCFPGLPGVRRHAQRRQCFAVTGGGGRRRRGGQVWRTGRCSVPTLPQAAEQRRRRRAVVLPHRRAAAETKARAADQQQVLLSAWLVYSVSQKTLSP